MAKPKLVELKNIKHQGHPIWTDGSIFQVYDHANKRWVRIEDPRPKETTGFIPTPQVSTHKQEPHALVQTQTKPPSVTDYKLNFDGVKQEGIIRRDNFIKHVSNIEQHVPEDQRQLLTENTDILSTIGGANDSIYGDINVYRTNPKKYKEEMLKTCGNIFERTVNLTTVNNKQLGQHMNSIMQQTLSKPDLSDVDIDNAFAQTKHLLPKEHHDTYVKNMGELYASVKEIHNGEYVAIPTVGNAELGDKYSILKRNGVDEQPIVCLNMVTSVKKEGEYSNGCIFSSNGYTKAMSYSRDKKSLLDGNQQLSSQSNGQTKQNILNSMGFLEPIVQNERKSLTSMFSGLGNGDNERGMKVFLSSIGKQHASVENGLRYFINPESIHPDKLSTEDAQVVGLLTTISHKTKEHFRFATVTDKGSSLSYSPNDGQVKGEDGKYSSISNQFKNSNVLGFLLSFTGQGNAKKTAYQIRKRTGDDMNKIITNLQNASTQL